MASLIDTLLGTSNTTNSNTGDKLVVKEYLTSVDKNWLRNSYLVNVNDMNQETAPNAFWSNAYVKYTDTSLGGNFGINTKYGFTPSADVPIAGRLAGREIYDSMSETMNFGMGRRYSEMFDDNEQILFLELGDPQFNSLMSFITNGIDYGTSVVANTGRSLAAYYAGQAIGAIIGVRALFVAFPFWGAALFLAFAGTVWFMSTGQDFSYYKMAPAMHKYWRAVNILASQMGVELGFMAPEIMPKEANSLDLGMPIRMTSEFADEFRSLIPGLLTDENYFDVFAVANRTQVLINNQKSLEREYYQNGGKMFTYADKIAKAEAMRFSSYIDELFKLYKQTDRIYDDTSPTQTDNSGAIEKLEATQSDKNKNDPSVSKARPKSNINKDGTVSISEKEAEAKSSWFSEFFNYVDSSARHGANFATFRVEYTGSVTESFSNSVTEVPLRDMLNNVSKKSRSVMFSASGGNLVGQAFTDTLNYGKDFLMGALDKVTFGLSNVVTALMGGGYYDIPKMWEDSSFEYQKHTFKMRLTGPYGHPIAQMQDMYIPLFMLICACASQSVGKAGYTSPMLCAPFIKGIMNTPLALMDSLVIERGVGNMGFDKRGRPLAIDVSFSFIDLTSFITMPVQAGLFGPISAALDDSSPMARYIQLLAGRDLYSTKYAMPKARLKYSKLRQGISMMNDPSMWGTMVGSSLGGSVFGSLIEGFSLPRQQFN